jgi:hypothetical protein
MNEGEREVERRMDMIIPGNCGKNRHGGRESPELDLVDDEPMSMFSEYAGHQIKVVTKKE